MNHNEKREKKNIFYTKNTLKLILSEIVVEIEKYRFFRFHRENARKNIQKLWKKEQKKKKKFCLKWHLYCIFLQKTQKKYNTCWHLTNQISEKKNFF